MQHKKYEDLEEVLNVCPEYSLGEDAVGNLMIRVDTGTFMDSTFSYGKIIPVPTVDGRSMLDYNIVFHQFIVNGLLKDPAAFPVEVEKFQDDVATPVLVHIYKSMQASEEESGLILPE